MQSSTFEIAVSKLSCINNAFEFDIRDHPFKTSANFSRFLTPTPYRRQFFTTIRWQIWQIFDPSHPPTPTKKWRRLKWMVPYTIPLKI